MKKEQKNNQFSFLSSTVVEEALVKNPFEKISNVVSMELERAIISAELAPGQKLNISQIAAAMQVSPSPVWEAIERLQQIGLVTAEPIPNSKRNNYRVFEMEAKDIEDLFLTRAALESLAAEICASKNWNVDIEKLKEYAVQFKESLERFSLGNVTPNPFAVSELDRNFHTLLINSTQNRFLIDSYYALDKIISFLSIKTSYYIGLQLNRDDALKLGNQHLAVVSAIENEALFMGFFRG